MKKYLLSAILAFSVLYVSAQKVINQPKSKTVNAKELTIEKVVLSDTATVLYFKAQYWPGTWFRIASDTYLQNGDKKLVARSISGMRFNKEYYPEGGKASFSMSFPPIDAQTKQIDFIEGDCDNCFRIIDIELQPSAQKKLLPDALYGNWYKTDGSKDWLLGVYDDKIVYDSKVWNYNGKPKKGKNIVVKLKNGAAEKELVLKQDKDGTLYAGENKNTLLALKNQPITPKYTDNSDGFAAPVLKNDSALYSGYINGYSPKFGFKTCMLYVNNIITGKQEGYTINIAPDGSFSSKFPMSYPEECFVRFPNAFSTVYIEPGKNVFNYINLTKEGPANLFMGDCATVNRELEAVKFAVDFDYNQIRKDILNLSLVQFKDYINNIADKKITELNNYRAANGLSAKTYQLTLMNIKYRAAYNIIDFNSTKEYAYRDANKIPYDKRENALTPENIDMEFLRNFKSLPVSDEVSVVSGDYNSFINRLKFSKPLFSNLTFVTNLIKAFNTNPKPSTKEKQAVAELEAMIAAQNDAGLNDFYKKYLPIIQAVTKKNEDLFKSNGANVIEENRKKALANIFNTDISFVLQVMNAQDRAQAIDAEFKPLTAGRLDSLKQEFTNINIYNTLVTLNAGIVKKIEDNKSKTGYAANEVPKTVADSVFAAITNKYKGKIIYVDFWATWCGPCRMGIESIAPLKEELKNENIVFLYITNPSSPIGTYNNMIPDIKGEHYRVNNDEWNVLAGKFKISGIPHYALVNKNGVVIDDALKHMENGELKTKLLALAKE